MFDGPFGSVRALMRFPDWYYGGPFAAVGNPDADLPRRVPTSAISEATRQRVEASGLFEGQRVVAPFNDANSLEDILSELVACEGYPSEWSDEERVFFPTIQGALATAVDRLREKGARSRGPRASWLARALGAVQTAADAYRRSDYDAGAQALRDAAELVRGAGRAGRRIRSIALGSGDAH